MADVMTCPGCETRFRWSATVAGKKVRCKCGRQFVAPAASPAPEEPETYELDIDDEPAPPRRAPASDLATPGKCPDCNAAVKPGAVVCVQCGFNLAAGQKLATEINRDAPADEAPENESAFSRRSRMDEAMAADMARQHRWQDRTLPLIFLIVGAALTLFNAAVLAPWADASALFGGSGAGRGEMFVVWMLVVAVDLAITLPLLFAAIVVSAKLFGTGFGTLGVALFKLLALAVVLGAVDGSVTLGLNILLSGFGGIGWMLQIAVIFGVFLALCFSLFEEIEYGEALIMFLFIYMGPMFIFMFAWPIVQSMLP